MSLLVAFQHISQVFQITQKILFSHFLLFYLKVNCCCIKRIIRCLPTASKEWKLGSYNKEKKQTNKDKKIKKRGKKKKNLLLWTGHLFRWETLQANRFPPLTPVVGLEPHSSNRNLMNKNEAESLPFMLYKEGCKTLLSHSTHQRYAENIWVNLPTNPVL